MAKEVMSKVKLQLSAGKANPAPPVGSALGPKGINIPEFCKSFNAQTQDKMGFIIPVEITIYTDLLKKAAKIETAAHNSKKEVAGTITKAQLQEIAQTKLPDLNASSIEAAMNIVAGTARSMGIKINE